MPFDAHPTHPDPTPQDLADLLRDHARWPAGFRWNYSTRKTCAIELCRLVWGEVAFARFLASIPNAFACVGWRLDIPLKEVTPEDVADYIEASVATATRAARRRP
jgi:hypothetical protein